MDRLGYLEKPKPAARFVLELHKSNGEAYPPNSLYQIVVCGLQPYLHNHGRADIKLFDNPAFYGFYSISDGEMKWLNVIGKYINKKQAEPNQKTVCGNWDYWGYWETTMHAQVLLNTLIFQVGLFHSEKWE